MAKTDFNAKIGADTTEFNKKLKGLNDSVKGFGATIAGVAGLTMFAKFTAEAVKLAAKTEGIKKAFDRLNNPMLLNNLRIATRNTVADVDLMSAAVRANNFRISLENLPKYFAFAQQRARETGESVDYLVDSIVMGIGRKSAMILDNLGISLSEINEELKKTPDYATAVGNIIERSIGDAGDAAETAADQIASLGAAWKNLMTIVGDKALNVGIAETLGLWAALIRINNDPTLSGDIKKQLREATIGTKLGNGRYANNLNAYDEYISARAAAAQKITGGYNYGNAFAAMQQQIMGGMIYPSGTVGMPSWLLPNAKTTGTTEPVAPPNSILEDGYWEKQVQSAIEYENFMESMSLQIKGDFTPMIDVTLSQVDALNQLASTAKDASVVMTDFAGISDMLTSQFENLFSAGIQGWDEFGKAAVQAITQMLIQLAALAATYAVLSLIPGFAGFMETVGGFSGFVRQGMGFGSAAATNVSSSTGPLALTTKISGSDLAVIVSRGGNKMGGNT